MPSSRSDAPPAHDYRTEISGEPKADSSVKRYPVSRLAVTLLSVFEILCWIVGAFVLYWLVPLSRDAFMDRGVEMPSSAILAITVVAWIVRANWIALPLILAGIIAPKVVVFSRTRSVLLRTVCVMAGVAVPLTLAVYALGLPKLIQLGIWP